MGHAENILRMLEAKRCTLCGMPAVRGATICLGCVRDEDLLDDALPGPLPQMGNPIRTPRTRRTPSRELKVAGS